MLTRDRRRHHLSRVDEMGRLRWHFWSNHESFFLRFFRFWFIMTHCCTEHMLFKNGFWYWNARVSPDPWFALPSLPLPVFWAYSITRRPNIMIWLANSSYNKPDTCRTIPLSISPTYITTWWLVPAKQWISFHLKYVLLRRSIPVIGIEFRPRCKQRGHEIIYWWPVSFEFSGCGLVVGATQRWNLKV